MKLNYREKVILAIFLAALIIIVCFVALIKPKNASIKSHESTLKTKQSEEQKVKDQIAKIPVLKTSITDTAAEAKKIVKEFVKKSNIEGSTDLDIYMQHYADENHIRLDKLEVTSLDDGTLDYYYIDYGDIGSKLRENADLSGNLQAEQDKLSAEKNQLDERNDVDLFHTQYGFNAHGTKKDLWNFMSAIENCKESIIIDEVSFSLRKNDEDEDEDKENEEGEKDEAAKAEEEAALYMTNFEDDTELDIRMVISLYTVYDAQEPAIGSTTDEED